MPTAINWPSTLPQKPEQQGYREVPQDGLVRSKNDAGPSTVRRRFTAISVNVEVQFVLDTDDMLIFEDFYRNTILDGALTFNFYSPITDSLVEHRFRNPPTISARNAAWGIRMSLERLPA